jgi:uncharacterized protein YndB with AHSA1/START domain
VIDREQYAPGPANGAQIRKDGEKWTLILVRELRHSPEKVWQALTDPADLREWAPFEADGSLGTVGTTVKLTTVGAPARHVTETIVTRADVPKVLVYKWGDHDIRWELEAFDGGTRLTLWTNIGRRFISMGAAGWHICFDVLDRLLSGTPIGRLVGPDAVKLNRGGLQNNAPAMLAEATMNIALRNVQVCGASSSASTVSAKSGDFSADASRQLMTGFRPRRRFGSRCRFGD